MMLYQLLIVYSNCYLFIPILLIHLLYCALMSKLAIIPRILPLSAVISGLLSLAMGAHAELPSEIQQALSRAQLSSSEISLIIMPLYNLDNGNSANSKEAAIQRHLK